MLVLTFSSKPITFCGCLWCASKIKVKPIIKYTRCGRRGSFTKLSLRLNFLSYREFLYLTIVDRTICYFSVLIQAKILDDIFFRSFRGADFLFFISNAKKHDFRGLSMRGFFYKEGVNKCHFRDLPVEGKKIFNFYCYFCLFLWLIYEEINFFDLGVYFCSLTDLPVERSF